MSKGKVALYVIGGLLTLSLIGNMIDDTESSSTPKIEIMEQKGLSNEEYNLVMADHYGTFSGIMDEFSNLMFEGSNDPSILDSPEYLADIQEVCDILLLNTEEMRAVEPPADFEDEHSRLMDALDHFEIVAEELPSTIENLDTNNMPVLIEHMNEGNAILGEIIEEYMEVGEL